MEEFSVYDLINKYMTPYKNGKDYNPKLFDVTTNCPKCKKDWTREVPEECLINGMGLALCPECGGEDITMVGNDKVWK